MATKRPTLDRVWASKASASNIQDPDILGNAGKVEKGWVAEIPPFQWFNWIFNRNDKTKRSLAERGIFSWGTDISYEKGALTFSDTNNTIYVALEANKGQKPTELNSRYWAVSACNLTDKQYQDLRNRISAHEANRSNPHKVTAAQVGAYTKAQTDNLIKKLDTEIKDHEALRNNPHKVTATQAGAVPVTGGTYTGSVTFNQDNTYFGKDNNSIWSSGNQIGMVSGKKMLGMTKNGAPAFWKDYGQSPCTLLYEENFDFLKFQHQKFYTVPTHDYYAPLSSDISVYEGNGHNTLTRNTFATYINKRGQLEFVDPNVPRIDDKGLILECGSVNIAREPEKLGKTKVVLDSFLTERAGLNWVISTPNPQGYNLVRKYLPIQPNKKYTVSVYANLTAGGQVKFHWEGNNTSTLAVPSDEVYVNGFRRYTYTFDSGSTNGNVNVGFWISGANTWTYGAFQIEELPFATSYMGYWADYKRSPDILQTSCPAPQNGTMHFDFTLDNYTGQTFDDIATIVGSGNRLEVTNAGEYPYINVAGQRDFSVNWYGFGTDSGGVGGALINNVHNNSTLTYTNTEAKWYLGGALHTTRNLGNHSNAYTGVSFNADGSMCMHIKNFRVWNTVLTKEQISTI